jgi:hypothetical protein
VAAGAGRARQHLHRVLDARGAPNRVVVHAVGNAHIDTAWLWPFRETADWPGQTLLLQEPVNGRPGYRPASHHAGLFQPVLELPY